MALKTDYKDDIFSGNRKYQLTNNDDETISLTDVTDYSQEGTVFGAEDINATNTQVNSLGASITKLQNIIKFTISTSDWTSSDGVYVATKSCSVTADDVPYVQFDLTGQSVANMQAINEAWTPLNIETISGAIKFTFSDKPTVDIPIIVKGA